MNDNTNDDRLRDEPDYGADELLSGHAPQPALALDDDERLPWLESADDEDDDGGIDTGRLVKFAAFAVGLLLLIVGGIWYANHRAASADQVAQGGVIPAPAEPYKTEPNDKGGKTFAGTGDSAFAVSEGKNPSAKLGGVDTPVAPASTSVAVASAPAAGAPVAGTTPPGTKAPAPAPSAVAAAAPAAVTGGIGVQVGAYSSQATAEAGWSRLSSSQAALKGLKHRVLEGSADIGKVYRLQAVASDVAAANSLCATLKAAGVACQVKR